MSYRSGCALGRLDRFFGLDPDAGDIYVLRLQVRGVLMDKLAVPLRFAKAAGRAFGAGLVLGIGKMDYDVRGVLVSGAAESWQLDIICTWAGTWTPWTQTFKNGRAMAEELTADAELRSYHSGLSVESGEWLELAGDEAAGEVAYWRASPLLWDHALGPAGSTTLAFDNQQGVWLGTAERRQRQWTPPGVPPVGPGPGGPGSSSLPPGGTEGDKPKPAWLDNPDNQFLLLLGSVAAFGLLIWQRTRKKRKT